MRWRLLVDDVEPAEPLRFVGAGPEARIARPEPAHIAGVPPASSDAVDGFSRSAGSLTSGRRAIAETCARLRATAPSSWSKASANSWTPSSTSLCGHRVDRDAGLRKRRHRLLGLVDILFEGRRALCRDRGTRPSSPAASC